MDERAAEGFHEDLLPRFDGFDDLLGFGEGVGSHAFLGRVLRHTERNNGHGFKGRVLVVDVGERLVEHVAVVDARAHDDLSMHFGANVEEGGEPAERRGPATVAQHLFAHPRVGGMDADV